MKLTHPHGRNSETLNREYEIVEPHGCQEQASFGVGFGFQGLGFREFRVWTLKDLGPQGFEGV